LIVPPSEELKTTVYWGTLTVLSSFPHVIQKSVRSKILTDRFIIQWTDY